MPGNFRERVDTASAIKGILDSYPFGNGLLREILQNSDDAGAQTQLFILDSRSHGVETLLDPALAQCQGPALLCLNNTLFRDSDWTALRTIHGSNKRAEDNKTGKYGLGFRSCYHITDNPQILSGNKLVIFDPHEEFTSPNDGGVQLDIANEGDRYLDQLASFAPYYDAHSDFYNGTIVRLPLRNDKQRASHRIRDQAFSIADIRALFDQFKEKELKMALLFLKNVSSIELREIGSDGKDDLVGKVSIQNIADIRQHRTFLRDDKARFVTFIFNIEFMDYHASTVTERWRVCHSILDAKETEEIMSKRLGLPVGTRLKEERLFSHVALAYPLDSRLDSGQLFTLLPLPIPTGFPLHMHAVFALMPDRQALKNVNERGANKTSRENFLVEWNLAIFAEFVPRLWARLMEVLVGEDLVSEDIWRAWPPSNLAETYWATLPSQVVRQVFARNSPIFPLYAVAPSRPVTLSTCRLASSADVTRFLDALAQVEVPIVLPPDALRCLILQTLGASENAIKLTPNSAAMSLDASPLPLCRTADHAVKVTILEYLTTTADGSLDCAQGLPIVPTIEKDVFVSLTYFGLSTTKHILATKEIAFLFGNRLDKGMIALWELPDPVQVLFKASTTSTLLDIAAYDSSTLQRHLHALLGHLDPSLPDVPLAQATLEPQWFSLFWRWIGLNGLVSGSLQQFHLVPTSTGTLRKAGDGVLTAKVGSQSKRVLQAAGVPFASDSVPEEHMNHPSLTLVRPSDDINFVLDNISLPSISKMTANDIRVLQAYFSQNTSAAKSLSLQQRNVLVYLPIFPTLAGSANGKLVRSNSAASGEVIFVDAPDCPLPIVLDVTFVDISSNQPLRNLALLLDKTAFSMGKSEAQILEWAISYILFQPRALLDALLCKILSRLMDISSPLLEQLKDLDVIPVRSGPRKSSAVVIDPDSSITQVFANEKDRFPAESLVSGGWLPVMRAHGFVQTALTPILLLERIQYFAEGGYSSAAAEKALSLICALDSVYDNDWNPILNTHLRWIPVDGQVYASSDCRPKGVDDRLFDLALPICPVQLKNIQLLSALCWDERPSFDVLLTQLDRAIRRITLHESYNYKRIRALIQEFSGRSFTQVQLELIRRVVQGVKWIPLDHKRFVSSESALLSDDDPLHRIGDFRQLPSFYTDSFEIKSFLLKLGCTLKPSVDRLLDALSSLTASTGNIEKAVPLLEALSQHSLSEKEAACVLVPDVDGRFIPAHDACFNDVDSSVLFPELSFVHPIISRQLASLLGLPFASAVVLGDDEDLDDMEMGEELTTRIGGILRDYTVNYAMNEFVANAIDAGADTFRLGLDERTSNITTTGLASEMRAVLSSPSLLLYNNALFTNEDFRGLRDIGTGGKRNRPESIGRFGLGALTMFHFTDLPMVLSGPFIMILDPAGRYLPPKGNRHRTVLYRRIRDVRKLGLMHVLRDVWGVIGTEDEYDGTIFRLPLRLSASPLANPISIDALRHLFQTEYYHLASSSLFFTPLHLLESNIFSDQGPKLVWSISGKRSSKLSSDDGPYNARILSLVLQFAEQTTKETWLVATSTNSSSSVPAHHHTVMNLHKLLRSHSIEVGVAFLLKKAKTSLPYKLFSHLPLPVPLSVPFHVHAPFLLSSDRRNVRFDPVDAAGNRIPESECNVWLLSELVPPVHLFALSISLAWAIKKPLVYYSKWPTLSGSEGDLSKVIRESFYASFPSSPHPVCITASGTQMAAHELVFSQDEPEAIRTLLEILRSPNFAILSPHIQRECRSLQLSRVTGSFIRDTLSQSQQPFLRLYQPGTSQLLSPISEKETDVIVHYLLKERVRIDDLPLLWLEGASQPIRFCDAVGPIYYHATDISEIMLPCQLLSCTHYLISRPLLFEAQIGVVQLTSDAVAASLAQWCPAAFNGRAVLSAESQRYLSRFWTLRSDSTTSLPDPSNSPIFSDLPLFPTFNFGEHVTLNLFQSNGVLSSSIDPSLASIIDHLGLTTVQDLPDYYDIISAAGGVSLTLEVLMQKVSTISVNSLDRQDRETLAAWIRSNLSTIVEEQVLFKIRTLAIWECWPGGNGRSKLVSADTLMIVPRALPFPTILTYLPAGLWFAQLSSFLSLLQVPRSATSPHQGRRGQRVASFSFQEITPENILSMLRMPTTLEYGSLNTFKIVLKDILEFAEFGLSDTVEIPREDLMMVSAGDLYDTSIELFRECFGSQGSSHFVHRRLRHLQPLLGWAGLQNNITPKTFEACTRVIDMDFSAGIAVETLLPRATLAYQFYCDSLPQLLMSDTPRWHVFDDLRFVPRSLARRRTGYGGQSVEKYCRKLSLIVRPCDMVLPEYESVCWSQCARFQEAPPHDLISLNVTFGRPQASDVVQHLRVLALQAAQAHSGDVWVLKDLRDTYRWLNKRTDESATLLSLISNEPLFLNVCVPYNEPWIWRSAQSLVFDLPYDESGIYAVKGFLSDFRNLLIASGANTLHSPILTKESLTSAPMGDDLQAVFQDMRQRGQLLDITFAVSEYDDDHVQLGLHLTTHSLAAHRAFLAARVPHLRDAFVSGMSESTADQFSFVGNKFAAASMLEYMYRSKITLPDLEGLTSEKAGILLQNLLGILQIADAWSMEDLKHYIAGEVGPLVTPDTIDCVRLEANSYDAQALKDYCDIWRQSNHALLVRLSMISTDME